MGKAAGEDLLSKLDGALSAQVTKVTDGHNRLVSAAEELRHAMDEYIKRVVAERVSGVSLSEETRGHFAALHQSLSAESKSLHDAQERLTQAEKKLAERSDEVAKLKDRVSKFERSAGEQADAHQAAHKRIGELEKAVAEGEGAKKRVQELESDVASLQQTVNDLQTVKNRVHQLEQMVQERDVQLEAGESAKRRVEELEQLVQNERKAFEAAQSKSNEASQKKITELEQSLQNERQASGAARSNADEASQKKIADLEKLLQSERQAFDKNRTQANDAAQKRTSELEQLLKNEHLAAKEARVQAAELQKRLEAMQGQPASHQAAPPNNVALQEAQQRIAHLEREVSDAKASRDEARDATQKLLRSQQSNQGESGQPAERVSALEQEVAGARNQLEELVRQNEELRQTNSALSDQLQMGVPATQDTAELETAIQHLRAQMDQELANERAQRDTIAREAKELRFKWEAERERADEAVTKFERERSNGTKASLAMQLSQALEEQEKAQEESQRLRRQLEEMQADIARAKEQPAAPLQKAAEPAPAETHARSDEDALVASGLLTRDQLEIVRREQGVHPEKTILRLAVDLGFAEEKAVRAVLGAVEPPPGPKSVPIDQRLGAILVDAGVMSAEQLNAALHLQAREPAKTLGKILIEHGYTTDDVIAHALGVQQTRAHEKLKGKQKDDRRRVGQILVDAGVVTDEQLDAALKEQKNSPDRRLGAILVEKGFTTEDLVAQALGFQRGVEFVRIGPDHVQRDAVKLVNARLAEHHCCMPLRLEENRLVLAMVNPLDLVAIEDIERASERAVDPVVATATDIYDTIRQFYY